MFLTGFTRKPDHAPDLTEHPWTLPLVRNLDQVRLTTPVTFLVGENGCGKSTLLEGIAAGMDALAVGRHDVERDPSLGAARSFASGFRFARRRNAGTRLFLRAEDVRGFTDRIAGEMASMRAEADAMDREGKGGFGAGFLRGAAAALARSYGEDTARVRMARRSCSCCKRSSFRLGCICSTNRRRRSRRRGSWR